MATIKEASELGKSHGKSAAERVCLEPPFHLLPEILPKWRKRSEWLEAAIDDLRYHGRQHVNTESLKSAFKKAYADAGLKFVEMYIKELKDDGLLKETRRGLDHRR